VSTLLETRRIALLLEYEGTRFAGSQFQKNARTVQSVLEAAIQAVTSESPRAAFAGRTDSGVHAWGQVVSFVTGAGHSSEVFARALNYYLPEDVSVRAASEVPLGFDVRRRAIRRHYRYRILENGPRPVLERHFVWHVTSALDVPAMRQAAAHLLGEHDFAAFTQPSAGASQSTMRRVYAAHLLRQGGLLLLDIEGSAFLPQQVRRIAGALVEVGRGRLSPDDFQQFAEQGTAGAARLVAPPQGLCLMAVRYQEELFEYEKREDLYP